MTESFAQFPSTARRPGSRSRARSCTGPRPLRSMVRLLLSILVTGPMLLSCVAPVMQITTTPVDALLFVDGRAPGRGASVPLDYYGVVTLSARQPGNRDPSEPKYLDEQTYAEVPAPFSPWLFPLDFFLEATTYPFSDGRYHHQFQLELVERPERAIGTLPRDVDEVARTAAAAVIGR